MCNCRMIKRAAGCSTAPRLLGTVTTFLGSVLTDPDPSLSPDPELGNGVLIRVGASSAEVHLHPHHRDHHECNVHINNECSYTDHLDWY